MNTDVLTFFSPREARGGEMQVLTVESGQTLIEILVYSPRKPDLSGAARVSVTSDDDYVALIKEIKSALSSSGGGVLAELQPHNNFTRTALSVIKGDGFKPPRKMLRLSPAGPARSEDLPRSIDIPFGDHLVVPVTAEAEERLGAFQKEVKGFPPDLESSILNLIRRPSLEWRIERIERALKTPDATWTEQQRSQAKGNTFLEKFYRVAMRPIPIGLAIAAALLLTAGALTAYEFFERSKGQDAKEDTRAEEREISATTSSAPEAEDSGQVPESEPSANDIDESLQRLFKALKESDRLKALYTSHFSGHEGQPFDKDSAVIWGIAKLQALQLNLIQGSDSLLENKDHQAGIKRIFSDAKGWKALSGNKTALELMAWGSCQQFDKPELPSTNTVPQEPLTFKTGNDCEHFNSADIVAGLKALTEWVKKGTGAPA